MDLRSLIRRPLALAAALGLALAPLGPAGANPWNGKVVLQGFWWNAWNNLYPNDWHTYLAKLAPRLRDMGFDGIWIPPPMKDAGGTNSMGYTPFDHYDLGDKDQKGTVPTRFGTKDALLRLVAVAHANGLEIYPDIVLNHVAGGEFDGQAPDGSDKFKRFRYVAFGGPQAGRWPKDHWNFHPNPDNMSTSGDWNRQDFGPDICYDTPSNPGGNCRYMRNQARQWFVWFRKQTDVDGFRFDAVKHFPPSVVEDLLANAMGQSPQGYFSVGEFIDSKDRMDDWSRQTNGRAGTLDVGFRDALLRIVNDGGFFDMGSLPGSQQNERTKTAPFVNSHDSWKGAFWDSEETSTSHDDRDGDWRKNDQEAMPTLDPDNPRADVAYAAAMAVDGSPVVHYDDLFVNYGADRLQANPATYPVRPYVTNLVWAHQKLNFKDGAYKVRFRNSPALLVVERSGRAVIGMNDHGSDWLSTKIDTDFGPNVRLHDYSGANRDDIQTEGDGKATIWVPPMGYVVWGPAGITGSFNPGKRRTTQEFQLDDDLGDSSPSSPGYGGKVRPGGTFSLAGAVWAAAGTRIDVEVYTEGARDIELRISKPDANGAKSAGMGERSKQGRSTGQDPLRLSIDAEREGYHLLAARLTNAGQAPTRAYVKVEYEAPRESGKF
jgi:alpha-amylase